MARFAWTSERVARAIGARAVAAGGAERFFSGICSDTRRLRPGELFVALRGLHFDGAEFVVAAAEAGASGAVAERCPTGLPEDFQVFLVDDSLAALGALARERRRALGPTVVAITGTSGKTTTRVLAAAALGSDAYASPGNFNNLVGVPLSMLAAPEESAIWLLELASNQPGEIERLGRITEPDHAVITSVAEGHLEGFGDIDGVTDEKLALLRALKPGGTVFIPDEPQELIRRARRLYPDVRTVGLGATADVRPDDWSTSEAGASWNWKGAGFRIPGFGGHLVVDGMFALALGQILGAEPEGMARRLEAVRLPPMRGEIRRIGGLSLLVDCYNANPASFRAAIDALDALAAGRRRAALVGTMLELGERSRALHEQVAGWMLDAGLDLIAATGAFADVYSGKLDVSGARLIVREELEDAYHELAARLEGDEAVLLKASRGMQFERAIPLFERDFDVPAEPGARGPTDGRD